MVNNNNYYKINTLFTRYKWHSTLSFFFESEAKIVIFDKVNKK